MCVPDPEYLVAAVDSDQCGCLSEPVWKRESDGDRGACDSGDGGEYAGGGGILQSDGWEAESMKGRNEILKMYLD